MVGNDHTGIYTFRAFRRLAFPFVPRARSFDSDSFRNDAVVVVVVVAATAVRFSAGREGLGSVVYVYEPR